MSYSGDVVDARDLIAAIGELEKENDRLTEELQDLRADYGRQGKCLVWHRHLLKKAKRWLDGWETWNKGEHEQVGYVEGVSFNRKDLVELRAQIDEELS